MKTMSELLGDDFSLKSDYPVGCSADTTISNWLKAHDIEDAVPVKNVSGFVVVPCFHDAAFFPPEREKEAKAYFMEERDTNHNLGVTMAVVIADTDATEVRT